MINTMIDTQNSAIMSAGMRALREALGVVETEIFIFNIKNKGFDYTEWRRDNLWEDMTLEELFANAAEFERLHPEIVPPNATII
ncbi:MAG: hypothetical protein FWG87_15015 [Defluviitaleaceae bacterium]|nr:hypothetical protein [Defluviitaleaceae bacterium]